MQSFPRYLLALLITSLIALPASAIDPPHNIGGVSDCSVCHTLHGAPGGALTIVDGNANLCQSCHMSGGQAQAFPFTEADQALPGPGLPTGITASGFSHRWDSGPAGHVAPGAGTTSTGEIESGGAFTGNFAKTYTITITTQGDAGTAQFSWTDTQGGGASGLVTGIDVPLDEGVTATFTNGSGSPNSFLLNDTWNVFVRTDLNLPTDITMAARIENGKIMCSTCHDVHNQDRTPFDPAAPAYGGSGTGEGRHYQRIDNDVNQMCADCHSARDVLVASGGSHPVGVAIPGGDYQAPATLPLDASNQVACLTCHQIHYAPTNNGTLARNADVTAMCQECHTLAGAGASHLDTATGVLWPGGQYGTTFPENTDASQRGFCVNCHQPHGWPDTGTPTQDYASLLVEDASAGICFTCHDTDGPALADIHGAFTDTNCTTAPWGDCTVTGYQTESISNAFVNQRHDVTSADQAYSGGTVACANCHNPHLATSTQKIIDPAAPATPFTATYDFNNHGGGLDPMNPIGCTAQAASIGPAVEGVHNGDDLGTSAGTYTGTEDQTYTVTVSTGGAPPAAQITVTSTGADSSGPTSVTAFGTPIAVGTLGVTIAFADGGSGGTPGTVGPAVDPPPANNDTAVSGGTYGGATAGTYTVTVTTGGRPRNAIIECSGLDCGASTIVCQPTQPAGGPECDYDVPFAVGGEGVTITFSDPGNDDFVAGDDWTIAVTGPTGDGVLTAGDTWTIAATAATAGCSTAAEPDMVTFCLVCHNTGAGGSPPGVPGVTMSTDLIAIGPAFASSDQHGQVAGNNGVNGFMKAPWQDVVANGDGTWANAETPSAYASLQCNMCHDGHGSANIFQLKTRINVRGVQLSVGGGPGSGFEASPFTPESDHSPGDTTYLLPCFDGSTQVSCSNPVGVQDDHAWGAWCTFCHDMQTHGRDETDACRTGHMHDGGAF